MHLPPAARAVRVVVAAETSQCGVIEANGAPAIDVVVGVVSVGCKAVYDFA